MLMFLDLITSGLIREELPLGHASQPWALKIAAEQTDAEGVRLNALDMIIKAEGRKVKPGASKVHGLEERDCDQFGVKQNAVLALLAAIAGNVTRVVTFGEFDKKIILSLLAALEKATNSQKGAYTRRWDRPGLHFLNIQAPVCEQECQLPMIKSSNKAKGEDEEDGLRWPSLEEACRIILKEPPILNPADAWTGLSATKALYFELLSRGHFEQEAC